MAKMTEREPAPAPIQPPPVRDTQAAVEAATAALNPVTDQIAYLQSKGWRVVGNPEWESSRWFDPLQPLVSFYTEEPCNYQVEVREEYTDEQTGQIRFRWKTETRQVLAQDGRGGAQQAARRAVYHPKGTPLSRTDAMALQTERDMRELLAAEEARRLTEAKGKR